MSFHLSESKAGTPIKHTWLREMEVGQTHTIPDGVKLTSFRTLISNYAFESGKKFTVSKASWSVERKE